MKSFTSSLLSLLAAGSFLTPALAFDDTDTANLEEYPELVSRASSSYNQNGTDRVQFIPVPDNFSNVGDQNIYNNIAKQRGGEDNFNIIDLTLLNSPPLEQGWQAFFNQINNNTASNLTSSIRELVICRIAVLNKAQYEWDQHAPILTSVYDKSSNSGGDVLNFVKSTAPRALSAANLPSNIPSSLDQMHLAAFDYTDAMTLDVNVSNAVFSKLGANGFGNREIIELTTTIALYNAVSRFLVALHLGQNNLTWLPSNMQTNFSSEACTSTSSTTTKKSAASTRSHIEMARVVSPVALSILFLLSQYLL